MNRIATALLLGFALIAGGSNPALASECGALPGAMSPGSKELAKDLGKDQNNMPGQLMYCALQATDIDPRAVFSNCGCAKVIKKLCKFKWDKGILQISAGGGAQDAWCYPFKFLAF